MFQVQPIGSLEHPALAPYRTLRRSAEHRHERIFVAEGDKVVLRLLESGWEVVSVVLPPEHLPALEPALQAHPSDILVHTAAKEVLERITGFELTRGVMAVGRVPAPRTPAVFLRDAPRPLLLVALDGVSSADNVGTIVRTAAAFGAGALIQGESSCSPFLRRAVRNSMGTVFRLPVLETACLRETLLGLRAAGVRCLVTDPHAGAAPPFRTDLRGDVCLVLGSEGGGVSAPVRGACDGAIRIPMAPGVDSLNVNAAAAALLYEAARQRGGG